MEFNVIDECGNIHTGIKKIQMDEWTNTYTIGDKETIFFRTLCLDRAKEVMKAIGRIISSNSGNDSIFIDISKLAEKAGTPAQIKGDRQYYRGFGYLYGRE